MGKPGTWEFKMHQLQNWCNSVKTATKGIIKMKPTACAIQKNLLFTKLILTLLLGKLEVYSLPLT